MNTNSSHNTLKFHIIFENIFYSVCSYVCAHVYHERHVEICVCVHMYSKEGIRKSEDNFWGGVSFLLPLWDQAQVIGLVFIFWATSLAIKIF